MRCKKFQAFVERTTINRLGSVQIGAHVRILRTATGKRKTMDGVPRTGLPAANRFDSRSASVFAASVVFFGDQNSATIEALAADLKRVGDVRKVHIGVFAQVCGKVGGHPVKCRGRLGGEN